MAARPLNSPESDTSSVTLQSADLLHDPLPSVDVSNPWLAPRETTSKSPRKKNEIVAAKDSAIQDKSKNKLKKQTKLQEEKEMPETMLSSRFLWMMSWL